MTHNTNPTTTPSAAVPEVVGVIMDALRHEYQLRQALGWATRPAVLAIDPDDGPIWRVGVAEEDGIEVGAIGWLNGNRIEITFFQPFQPVEAVNSGPPRGMTDHTYYGDNDVMYE